MTHERIYIWPDGEWCYETEAKEFCFIKSDDYQVIELDGKFDTFADIDEYVTYLTRLA